MKAGKISKALMLMLACCMVVSLAACNKDDGGSGDALTEQEYQDAVTKLSDDITAIQNDVANMSGDDKEAGIKALEDMKTTLNEFINVTPPKAYEAAHEKLKSGSQAMVDFIDAAIEVVNEEDAEKAQEKSTEMMELMQTALTDLAEGSQLLADASK